MIRHVFSLGILAWLVSSAASAATAMVQDIELSSRSDITQVRLELSKAADYSLFTLTNPHRVVVDLRETELAARARVPAGRGPVAQIRTGRQPGNTLRVVIELESSIPANARWAPSPGDARHALVVNLGKMEARADEPPKPIRVVHAPKETDRDVVVAIDAGHGGQDPGAIGRNGTREKDVVLAISRALAKRINAERGMRAVLTRDADEFLSLRERIKRARQAKADLFVSVHADSIRNRDVSGASVYVLSVRGASDEAARWLAERENAADLMGGVSLDDKDNTLASVLLDLSQSANISASMVAAERVLSALDAVGEVRKPRVQQAGFVVLKSPDIPSMLIETAYISNPGEERRLRTSAHQRKLADAIFSGVRTYFEHSPPPGTRFALSRRATAPAVLAASPNAP